MTCEDALLLISGQLDGVNTAEETAQLRRHLDTCPECRQVMETLKELDSGVAELSAEPPADLKDLVMEAIRAEAKPKRKYRWMPVAVAAALVLVVGVSQIAQLRAQNAAAPMAVSAAYSRKIDDTAAYDAENGFFTTPTAELDSQTLADQRGGDVVVTRDLLPEMEVCACETLEDGTLLYILESADAAAELSNRYGLELYHPAEAAETGVSYARLVP